MSKLEDMKRTLGKELGLHLSEQAVKREHLKREGEFHWSAGLQVAPQEPVLRAVDLRGFSERTAGALMKFKPTNMSKCYQYAESRRDVVKTATLYFTEKMDEPGDDAYERRIMVTIYPCRVMAEDMGGRGTIELHHYDCPSPCAQEKKCEYKSGSKGFLYDAGRW